MKKIEDVIYLDAVTSIVEEEQKKAKLLNQKVEYQEDRIKQLEKNNKFLFLLLIISIIISLIAIFI